MKKLLAVGVVLVTSIALSGAALASGYGGSGCGPGSLIAGNSPGAMQLVGVSTNTILKPIQMSAISSGFSNCNPQGLVQLEKEREMFAQSNYSSLVREMAAGEGENLSTLAGMYGCSQKTSNTSFKVKTPLPIRCWFLWRMKWQAMRFCPSHAPV